MSAYSNLVGLYSSSKNIQLSEDLVRSNDWPEVLPWEPIPVHTVPKALDHVCYSFSENLINYSLGFS